MQDVTGEPRIIAEVDYDSAPSMVHEKAIYILEGRTYFVEKYDHEERRVRGARGRGRLLHRRHRLHQGPHPRPLRRGAAAQRPPQPRRGPRHRAGGGLQEDQVPHQRERGRGRADDARERDAHDLLLAHRSPGDHAGAALHPGGAPRRRGGALLHPRPAGRPVPDVRPARPRRGPGRQRPGRGPGRAGPAPRRVRLEAGSESGLARRDSGGRTSSPTSSSTTTIRAASGSRSRSSGSTTG